MFKLSEFLYDLKDNKPFLCILFFIFYTLGLFAFYCHETLLISSILTFGVVFILFILLIMPSFSKIVSPVFILILYLLFIFGFMNAKIHYVTFDDFSNIQYQKNVVLEGVVSSIPKINSAQTGKFSFDVKKAFIGGKTFNINKSTVLAVKRKVGANQIKFADTYKFKGTLSAPSPATNPSQFDYQKFLNNRGILKTFYIDEDSSSEFFQNKPFDNFTYAFTRKMYDIKDEVLKKHGKYIKSPKLEVLGGVVFGDDAVNTPDSVKDSFVNSGLLHLLAASGLNVALILSLWLCVVYFINVSYKLKIISGIALVFLYTVMTGFPPSIVRASVMFILILIGKLMYREANGISLIFCAGFLILIFKPEFLCDVGFQLSFLVTLGLISCVPSINHILKDADKKYIKKFKNYPKILCSFFLIFSPVSLACCIVVPLIAQLWAAPLQAYYFNTFSTYSLFANIAVIPFVGLVSFLGFISTAFCFLPKAADIILPVLDFVLNFVIQIVLNISNFFSSLPFATIRVPSPPILMIISFYVLVIFLFLSFKYLFKRRILNVLTIFSFVFLSVQFIQIPPDSSEVIFFNVGNADNCLIKTQKGKYILIDTGRTIYKGLSSAKTITLEYLYDYNIKEIDTLIVTHYDSDHSGGLVDILENVKVKNLISPVPFCGSKNSCAIYHYIKENNIKYIPPYTGQTLKYEPDIVLKNFVPVSKNKRSRNDKSTVTLLTFGDYKFLFMADAGAKAYSTIEDKLPNNIDVLKSAHHGAAGTVTDEMMKKLKPKYSILSTGKNPYGHPNKTTVDILSSYSSVLNTNDLGAIKFEVQTMKNKTYLPFKKPKNELKVYKFNGKKRKFEPA